MCADLSVRKAKIGVAAFCHKGLDSDELLYLCSLLSQGIGFGRAVVLVFLYPLLAGTRWPSKWSVFLRGRSEGTVLSS